MTIIKNIHQISKKMTLREVQYLSTLFYQLGKESQKYVGVSGVKTQDIFKEFNTKKALDGSLSDYWKQEQFIFPEDIQSILHIYKTIWDDRGYSDANIRALFKVKKSIPKSKRRLIHLGFLVYSDYVQCQARLQKDRNLSDIVYEKDFTLSEIKYLYQDIEKSIAKPTMSPALVAFSYGVIGLSLLGTVGQSVAISFMIFHGVLWAAIPLSIVSVSIILFMRFLSSLASIPMFRRLFNQDGRSLFRTVRDGKSRYVTFKQGVAMVIGAALSTFSAGFGFIMAYKNLAMMTFLPAVAIQPLAIACAGAIFMCAFLGSMFSYEKIIKEQSLVKSLKKDKMTISNFLRKRKEERGVWNYRRTVLMVTAVTGLNLALGGVISVMSALTFASLIAPVLGVSTFGLTVAFSVFFNMNSLIGNYYGTRELAYAITRTDELQNKPTNKILLFSYALFSAMNVYFPTINSGKSFMFALGFTSFRLVSSLLHAIFPDISSLKNEEEQHANISRKKEIDSFFQSTKSEDECHSSMHVVIEPTNHK